MKFLEKMGLYTVSKKQKTILDTLSNIIDEIETYDDKHIIVKLDKNIVLENRGSTITINNGYKIDIAKEIHFNPEIDLVQTDKIEVVSAKIENMKEEHRKAFQKKKEKREYSNCKDCDD